jgi:hypothetical protein
MKESYRGICAFVVASVGLLSLVIAVYFDVSKALIGFAVVRKITIPILALAVWSLFKDRRKIFGILAICTAIGVFFAPRFLIVDDFHRIKGDWSNIHFVSRTKKEIKEIKVTQNGKTDVITWLGEPKLLFAGLPFSDVRDSEFKIAVLFSNGDLIGAQSVEREKNGEILRSTVVIIEDNSLKFSVKYKDD